MEAKKLALLCRELAENRKAEDIVLLDVHELSSITDYFVVCSGTSEPHLRAIADEILTKLEKDHGEQPRARDGGIASGWLVLDFFDVIVHIMHTETRRRYDLEALWGDAPQVKVKKARKKAASKASTA
ncbi:MAG TPA: ribosome silencing factor [Verrucomicrobiales bacterium]|nr:ribosome silencing factor [Verrucomicrobiales bacterium]